MDKLLRITLPQDIVQASVSLGAVIVAGNKNGVEPLISAALQQQPHLFLRKIHVRHCCDDLFLPLHHAEDFCHIRVGIAQAALYSEFCLCSLLSFHTGLLLDQAVDVEQRHFLISPFQLADPPRLLLCMDPDLTEIHDIQPLPYKDKEI